MLNYKIIFKVLGQLLLFEVFLLLVAFGVGLLYHENMWMTFGIPIGVTAVVALLFLWIGKGFENRMGKRDGFLIVSLTWILFSIFGMLPFLVGGYQHNVCFAFFEAMSGFTTTGASIFNNVDALPYAINFWRCLTHWIGGVGIVFFTVAILPNMGVGELKLFSTESVGLKIGKLHPRIKTTAHWIGGIYLFLTVACAVSYYVAGMNVFDAVCHSFSTLGTGGFSTHQDSIGFFHSMAIDYVAIIFMILAGTNFTMLYLALFKRKWQDFFKDGEIHFYLSLIIGLAIAGTFLEYFHNHIGLEKSFRLALFHVTSIQTTTGFIIEDFTKWYPIVWCVGLVMMLIGGCSGATSGGVKCVRVLSIFKVIKNEFKMILHPHAVFPVKVNQTNLSQDLVRNIFIVAFCYLGLALFFSLFYIICGVSARDAISCCFSALSGVGPGMGYAVSPVDSWAGLPQPVLWASCFLMLAGRLEFFSLLILFLPNFWNDN